MSKKEKKPKIAIVGLTCCEGCEFAVLDLHEKFLELANYLDIAEFRMIKDDPPKTGPYDICFVEGSVVTKKNEKTLKELRRVSKKLIVLGNCAHTGGVHRMKNWIGRIKALGEVYDKPRKIDNPPILPISDIVKIDFVIPGCPVSAEEFLMVIKQILAGSNLQIPQNPVCYECQIKGYKCLLQKGELCCGPVTLGGCGAVCLKAGQPCWGCRGLIEEPDVEKFVKNCFLNNHPIGEITRVLEIFGIKDDWAEQAFKEWKIKQTPKDLAVVKPGKLMKNKGY